MIEYHRYCPMGPSCVTELLFVRSNTPKGIIAFKFIRCDKYYLKECTLISEQSVIDFIALIGNMAFGLMRHVRHYSNILEHSKHIKRDQSVDSKKASDHNAFSSGSSYGRACKKVSGIVHR